MAEDINRVILVGRLVRDAELSYTTSGYAVLKFSLAVNRRKKDGEQWIDEGHFFDASMFGKRGESIANYMTKGKQIALDGQLRQDRWTAQDGTKRSRVYIDAQSVQFIGGRDGNSAEQRQSDQGRGVPGNDSAPPPFDDDIPF